MTLSTVLLLLAALQQGTYALLPPWGQSRGNAGRNGYSPLAGPTALTLSPGVNREVSGYATPCNYPSSLPFRVESFFTDSLQNNYISISCYSSPPCDVDLCSLAPRYTGKFSYRSKGDVTAMVVTPTGATVLVFNASMGKYNVSYRGDHWGSWSVSLPSGVDPAGDVYPVFGSLLLPLTASQGYTLLDPSAAGAVAWTSSPPLSSFQVSGPFTPPVLEQASGRLIALAGRQLFATALSSGFTTAYSVLYPISAQALLTPTSLVAADGLLFAALQDSRGLGTAYMIAIDPNSDSSNASASVSTNYPLTFPNQTLSQLACGGGVCAGILSPSGDVVIASTSAPYSTAITQRFRVPTGAYPRGFASPVLAAGVVYLASTSGDLFAIDATTGATVSTAQLSASWAQWGFAPLPPPTSVTVQELALGGGVLLVTAQDSNGASGTVLVGFPPLASPTPLPPPAAAKAAPLSPSAAAGLGVGLTLAAGAALLAGLWRVGRLQLGGKEGEMQRVPLMAGRA